MSDRCAQCGGAVGRYTSIHTPNCSHHRERERRYDAIARDYHDQVLARHGLRFYLPVFESPMTGAPDNAVTVINPPPLIKRALLQLKDYYAGQPDDGRGLLNREPPRPVDVFIHWLRARSWVAEFALD